MLGALGPNGLGAPSRFLSSAPLRVRIPPLAHKKAPWAVMGSGRSILMAGTEGFRVRLVGGRVPLRRFASCVLRWKTLRVSSAPHPCGFEFLRLPTRKRSRFIRAWSAVFLRAGTEGFEPPTAGTKNRSSTVELRPNVWCCPKATRLVYLICEGIANAIEQAYGECLRVAGREGAVVARHARELNANACRLLLCGDIGSADALG